MQKERSSKISVKDKLSSALNCFWDGRAVPSIIAAGLSGGPDSFALAHILNDWAGQNNAQLHLLGVDHGLRDGSDAELLQIKEVVQGWKNSSFHILKWMGEKPASRIQEQAREARYRLLDEFCKDHQIQHLFLAHHQDDQAETFLLRLAKGSGLDGLSCMQPVHLYDKNLLLCRPFLDLPKADLVAYCEAYNLPYITDPSNDKDDFARVRLRQSRTVLEEEGLTSKRLSVTSYRLARARQALDNISEKEFQLALIFKNTKRIEFKLEALKKSEEEIFLRVILKAFDHFRHASDYSPRMERVEALCYDLQNQSPFRKRTLGGVVFSKDGKAERIILEKEGQR